MAEFDALKSSAPNYFGTTWEHPCVPGGPVTTAGKLYWTGSEIKWWSEQEGEVMAGSEGMRISSGGITLSNSVVKKLYRIHLVLKDNDEVFLSDGFDDCRLVATDDQDAMHKAYYLMGAAGLDVAEFFVGIQFLCVLSG